MVQKIADKSASILCVETSGAVRTLLTDVLRSLGFENVQSISSTKDALSAMEVEPVDWFISPLMSDQDVNCLQICKLIPSFPSLAHTRVSLIVAEDELDAVPAAFELGIMDWVVKPFNKDTITESFTSALKRLEELEWDDTLYAAERLRAYLTEHQKFDSRLSLEKSLVRMYPGFSDLLLNLVEPLSSLGQIAAAKATLHQVELLDPEQKETITELREKFITPNDEEGSEGEEGEAGLQFNSLDIQKAVVIDSTDDERAKVVEVLKELGVPEILEFSDGESAWEAIDQTEDIGVILHEWRVPKLTGPLLIQRIRKRHATTPVIVTTSLVEEEDKPLLREMGAFTLIQKPYEHHEIVGAIVHTIQQDRAPTETGTLEMKIIQLLHSKKFEDAMALREKYTAATDISEDRKGKIEAEFAFADKNYSLARDLAANALRAGQESIPLLNLLGKCLMFLREFDQALRVFKKAQKMSPQNIERLCSIAEAHSELGQDDEANKTLEEAASKDEGSAAVQESSAKVAMDQGDTDRAKEIMGQLESLSEIIAYMNNKAVAHARCGEAESSLEMYRQTIASIPEDRIEIMASVKYNLALAFARLEQYDPCLEVLEEVIKGPNLPVKEKATSLSKRVSNALQSNVKLVIRSGGTIPTPENTQPGESSTQNAETAKPEAVAEQHTSQAWLLAPVQTSAGDLCCFQVFQNPEDAPEIVTKLLSTIPHFSERQAIKKEGV
ncbi:MAG: response regulator [Oligoflexales bacterium]